MVCLFSSLVAALALAGADLEADAESLRIIEAVEAAEALYDPIRIEYVETMRRTPETIKADMKEAARRTDGKSTILESRQEIIFHRSGIRELAIERDLTRSTTDEFSGQRSICFDGERTVSIERDDRGEDGALASSVVNVTDAPINHQLHLTPHVMLMLSGKDSIPLSEFFRGNELGPSRTLIPYDGNVRLTYGGEEVIANEPCDVLTWDYFRPDGVHGTRRVFWLAKNKNYIPLRQTIYSIRASPDQPTSESAASELEEALPGLWFPRRSEISTFSSMDLSRGKGPNKLYDVERMVTALSLTESLPADACEDITIEPGSTVYTIENDKIVSAIKTLPEEVESASPVPGRRPDNAFRWSWVLVLVVAVAAILVWRRR